ncbi:MAG: 50S ribosomal protein L13 [candidate division KSB1 bacterium]|nr:50S ribosomal protein L13 [candidate division KSB1 bacterium]MDZ7303211.1 50S ribosomal protein L13 [candidate division KSB1 bacterium]MDZ7312177.1 50S ribosomal protein L13 [candidate division KSB1 bacterium]
MRTYIPKPDEVERKWYVVDASGLVLGRLASQIATVLRGKHKPHFTPHMDVGDFVVVINAEKVILTGKKADIKIYSHYTGYPGGLRQEVFSDLQRRRPERIVEYAVWGMLPHTRLGKKQFKKLKVYRGQQHPHAAQKPEPLHFASLQK